MLHIRSPNFILNYLWICLCYVLQFFVAYSCQKRQARNKGCPYRRVQIQDHDATTQAGAGKTRENIRKKYTYRVARKQKL